MAKINWVFQDESGTNLNRYIATNVATGEEITFDLSSGGNITIIGTPLNAEKLNSLINAINDIGDDYFSKEGGTINGDITLQDGKYIKDITNSKGITFGYDGEYDEHRICYGNYGSTSITKQNELSTIGNENGIVRTLFEGNSLKITNNNIGKVKTTYDLPSLKNGDLIRIYCSGGISSSSDFNRLYNNGVIEIKVSINDLVDNSVARGSGSFYTITNSIIGADINVYYEAREIQLYMNNLSTPEPDATQVYFYKIELIRYPNTYL